MVTMAGCQWNEKQSDAFGQFQATEVQVAAEHRGQLRHFQVNEGQNLVRGDTVGWIDTTELIAQKEELQARLQAARNKIPSIRAERRVLESELKMAHNDLNRLMELKKDEATTQKQIDDVRGRIDVLRRKIEAVEVNIRSAKADINALQARLKSVSVQISNALIVNPVPGTVLTTYKETGEIVQYGQPLYKIADLDTMKLRVYVSGAQLPQIELGQAVKVLIDDDEAGYQQLMGSVSWIASEAEFTPQMIQTKEERVSQVYAVEIRVANDGRLKMGMPGEARF